MSKEVFELFPSSCMKRCISKAPSVSLEFKLVNNIESQYDPEEIATKNIHNDMIPPTLFKIIQNVS